MTRVIPARLQVVREDHPSPNLIFTSIARPRLARLGATRKRHPQSQMETETIPILAVTTCVIRGDESRVLAVRPNGDSRGSFELDGVLHQAARLRTRRKMSDG